MGLLAAACLLCSAAFIPCVSSHACHLMRPWRRLPSEHPTLIKWSAPAFVKIRLASLGLSLGRQTVHSFTACMASDTREAGLGWPDSLGDLHRRAQCLCAAGQIQKLRSVQRNCADVPCLTLCPACRHPAVPAGQPRHHWSGGGAQLRRPAAQGRHVAGGGGGASFGSVRLPPLPGRTDR